MDLNERGLSEGNSHFYISKFLTLVKAKLINVAHAIFAFVARSFGKRVLNNSIKTSKKIKQNRKKRKQKKKTVFA